MKRKAYAWLALLAVLAALAGALGCAPAAGPAEADEAAADGAAVSVEELQSRLDALAGTESKALFSASSIPKPSGGYFTVSELTAFVDGIKVRLAGFVSARGSHAPYLVIPQKIKAGGQSGLMWVPFSLGRRLSAPILAYQHGTEVNWKCAPSRYDPNPLAIFSADDVTGALVNYVECTAAALMASAGYIVVMADYPGFGDSRATHPYVHLSLGDSVLSMVDRAKAVLAGPFASARPNGKLYLIGYSEGGFATMAAAKTFQDRGCAVTAAVPCAGSYDLAGAMVADILSGKEAVTPYYVPYTVYGYASVYAAAEPAAWDYAALLKPPLPSLLPALFSGSYSGAAIGAAMPTKVPRDMLTDSLAAQLAAGNGPVYARLCENTVFRAGWVPRMIVQMVHCPADDVVPAANALAVAAAYAGLPNVLPPIWVDPVPLTALTDVHLLAYPTAMLAGFMFIDALDATL